MVASRLKKPGWLVLGGLLLIVLGWFGLPRMLRGMAFFRIRRVEFVGLRYLTPAQLLPAIRLPAGASVFDRPRGLVARLDSIPGVQDARIGRRLPGTLRVTITELDPVALAPGNRGMQLVDARGRTLAYDPAGAVADLPVVDRPDSAGAALLGRIREVDPGLFGGISTAHRTGSDVLLEVDGKRVWLRADATAEAIDAVTAVAEDLARQGRAWSELDGRYTLMVVVRGSGA